MSTSEEVRKMVCDRYAQAALGGGCCSSSATSSCCGGEQAPPGEMARIMGYEDGDLRGALEEANLGLGCGNPTALGKLKFGETVLDLGSGGGIDCFRAARTGVCSSAASGPLLRECRTIGCDLSTGRYSCSGSAGACSPC